MTLISMRWSLLATAFALLSCATQPPVDPLEAKAREGDPVASCQLAARSLHSCALEKQKWESGALSARPACVDNGIGDQQEADLDAARDKLRNAGGPAMLFQIEQLNLLTTQMVLVVLPGDYMVESTATLEQDCMEMADFLKP
jgi:hypothetical protein